MPVVGLVIKSIEANKKEDITGPLKIDNQTSIKNVEETELPAIDKKGLKMEFEFKSLYHSDNKKNIADIVLKGDVFALEKDVSELSKEWKKTKKLPEDLNIQAVNSILRRCITESLVISEKLQLPPPIPLPLASKKVEEKERYIG